GVGPVAPGTASPASPAAEPRCHWRVRSTVLLQTRSSALSTSPPVVPPVTAGAASALGGAICTTGAGAATAAVGADVELAVPSAIVAVTTATRVEPSSSSDVAYAASVALAMSGQADVA